jgi:acetyl/propionyl-CoA carboxylase alpha subunit
VQQGSVVPVHYDPLLAKLIVWGENRETARRRAIAALRRYAILGIRTNIPYLIRLLEHPEVRRGAVHTGFIDEHHASLAAPAPPPVEAVAAAVMAHTERAMGSGRAASAQGVDESAARDPWSTLRGWGR